MLPTLRHENRLYRAGYKYIAGLDEVGRGALAGPIVAAALLLSHDFRIRGLKDSKKLTYKKREEFYEIIVDRAVGWGVGIVSEKFIDRYGIEKANQRAMQKAVCGLTVKPDYILSDFVRFKLSGVEVPFEPVVSGDQKIHVIAAASIVAKVTRDRMLCDLHVEHPEYGFDRHKGYGTREHLVSIQKHGPCAMHRMTYVG